MPSIYVHNYFARDLNNKLKKEKVKQINNDRFIKIFAQGFDNLFYYNFLSIKPGNKYRKLGHYAHVHNVWDYYKNILVYMKENKLYDDENLGYLYGFLSHYTLDSTAHPYVHYISGRFSKKDFKHTKQYLGNHAINEIMLDAIYYYKEHDENYCRYKLYKDIIPITKFSDSLINNINNTFKKTFNVDNIGVIYNKSYNQSRYIYKYLMKDRFGIKKFFYKIFDALVPHKNFKAYSYSHHITKINYNVLNKNHNTWLHPVTGDKHNESFEDLYNIAMDKTIERIKICNDYFNDKCSLDDVQKIIENISYSSGLDLNIKPLFKYFGIKKSRN